MTDEEVWKKIAEHQKKCEEDKVKLANEKALKEKKAEKIKKTEEKEDESENTSSMSISSMSSDESSSSSTESEDPKDGKKVSMWGWITMVLDFQGLVKVFF